MKILFVCENYLPHLGGAEVVFKNLAEGFVKLGHEVFLVTHRIKDTKKYELMNGVKVYRINCFKSRYLFSFLAIPKVLKLAKKADVIQTTSFNGAPPAWLASRLIKKPVVITVHENWINKWDKVTDLSKLSCFIHNLLEKRIYALKYDKYICVSNATRNDIINDVIKNKASEKKAVTIYNGLDYQLWNPNRFDGEKVREQLNLKDKFVCFSWGRPGMSKGFEYLIEAMPKISAQIPNSILLLMLGSKETHQQRYEKLLSLIRKHKLNDKIKIIPSVPYEQLGNFIAAADCAIVPSVSEGFGYSAIEACTMNIPLVATNVGSLPEVVSGKFVLVNSKNPDALAEGVLKIKEKNYTSTTLKKLNWERAIQEYLRIYQELV